MTTLVTIEPARSLLVLFRGLGESFLLETQNRLLLNFFLAFILFSFFAHDCFSLLKLRYS